LSREKPVFLFHFVSLIPHPRTEKTQKASEQLALFGNKIFDAGLRMEAGSRVVSKQIEDEGKALTF
jgi:hypothetical protein